MKNIFLLITILSYLNSYSQDIPSDSLILKTIFGKTDKAGKTFSCKYSGDEAIFSYQDSVVYRTVFKSKVNLDNQNLILAIIEAPYGTQNGHQFGYRDIYFLKSQEGKLELVDSVKSDGITPIGDKSAFEVVDIGRNKKALISTFQSTGNQHFENTKNILLLELNNLTYLFSIYAEYDNSSSKPTETENDSCQAERFEETYEIIKTDSEWYNIKVHRKTYGFTKGCKERYITQDSDKEYSYRDGKYVESNIKNN